MPQHDRLRRPLICHARRLRIDDPEQEVDIALWQARAEHPGATEGLIMVVARRRLSKIARSAQRVSRGRGVRFVADDSLLAVASDSGAGSERSLELRRMLSRAGLNLREQISLDAWAAGCTSTEIAERIGCSRSNAHLIVAQILARLGEQVRAA